MRIARVETPSGWLLASEQPDGRFSSLGVAEDLADLLRAGTEVQTLPEQEDLEVLRVGAPLRPAKIVAIGLNYADHVRETGMQAPQTPLVFAKFPGSVIGPDESIVLDRGITQRVDWEVELGVVVGRRLAGHVTEAQALSAIFGYTAANDVSARDVQFSDGQWIRGKSMDTFCPLGPVVVTAEEVADPGALRLRTRVNGEVVQESSTAEMIFSVAKLLTFCARSFTLDPGDLLLTGTPWGCGEFMTPQRSLQAGDVVEVEVEGVGRLANPVVEAG